MERFNRNNYGVGIRAYGQNRKPLFFHKDKLYPNGLIVCKIKINKPDKV